MTVGSSIGFVVLGYLLFLLWSRRLLNAGDKVDDALAKPMKNIEVFIYSYFELYL